MRTADSPQGHWKRRDQSRGGRGEGLTRRGPVRHGPLSERREAQWRKLYLAGSIAWSPYVTAFPPLYPPLHRRAQDQCAGRNGDRLSLLRVQSPLLSRCQDGDAFCWTLPRSHSRPRSWVARTQSSFPVNGQHSIGHQITFELRLQQASTSPPLCRPPPSVMPLRTAYTCAEYAQLEGRRRVLGGTLPCSVPAGWRQGRRHAGADQLAVVASVTSRDL